MASEQHQNCQRTTRRHLRGCGACSCGGGHENPFGKAARRPLWRSLALCLLCRRRHSLSQTPGFDLIVDSER